MKLVSYLCVPPPRDSDDVASRVPEYRDRLRSESSRARFSLKRPNYSGWRGRASVLLACCIFLVLVVAGCGFSTTVSAATSSSAGGSSTASAAAATISFVQAAAATPQTPTATVKVAYKTAQTVGDMNIVVVGWNDATSTVQSVKDSAGNTYKLAIGPTSGSALRQSIYFAPNIKAGSNAVTIAFNKAAAFPDIRILEYRGVTVLDAVHGASGNSSTANSGAAPTHLANELVIGANTVATLTAAPGSGYTSRGITSPDGGIVEDKVTTAAGSNSATATLTSSGPWVMQMASFSAGTGSPATPAVAQWTMSSTALNFGNVALGLNASRPVTITSTGTAALTISSASISGTGYSLSGAALPLTLNPKQTATLNVRFVPTAAGSRTGALTVKSNAATNPTATVSLSANATSTQPTISSVSPNNGSTTGGTSVTITGGNFASGATVKFGSTAASSVAVVNSTTITAKSPTGSAGAVTVTVTNSNGQSGSLTNGFTYTNPSTIGFVQVASATPRTATQTVNVSYAKAETAGNMNVIIVGWNDTVSTVQSLKDSAGNTYKLAIGPTSGTNVRQSIYYAPNIKAGSNTVTVTFNRAAAFADVRVLEYRGVTTLDAVSGASGNSTSPNSGAATTHAANELVVGADTVATLTGAAGSGFTSRIITSPDGNIAEDKVTTALGSNSATAALTASGPWVMQMATFAPTSGGVGIPAAPQWTMTSGSLNFGNVTVGQSSTLPLTITSNGTAALTISSAAISGTGFSVSGASFPMSLNPGQSVTLSVRYAPTAAGTGTGALTLKSNASTSPTVAVGLSGTGTSSTSAQQLSVSTTNLSFGDVTVGSSATLSVTLTSTGTSAVTVNSASISGTGFSVSGAAFPVTLNSKQAVTLQVKFAPTAASSATGSLTIRSNASTNPTVVVSLSGTGTQHEVDLSWAAPSGASVSGYHVYRATGSSTSYQVLNSSITSSTSYADKSVTSGTAYTYYVTSVNSSGQESSPSNKISVNIP